MSTQTEKLTPTGKVIQYIIKGRNNLAKLIEDDITFTIGLLDDALLAPLARLAMIDRENQKKV